MSHTIEPASSGRAKCRGCGTAISKGELRFGERLPNPFSEGKEMTHWFHLRCAAMKRPDVLLETLDRVVQSDAASGAESGDATGGTTEPESHAVVLEDEEVLRQLAAGGLAHRRLPRINGAERAPSGRARCRHCREMIPKDEWRISLVYYDEGQFNPSGYIHLTCSRDYLETTDVVDRLAHFSPDLTADDLASIGDTLEAAGPG